MPRGRLASVPPAHTAAGPGVPARFLSGVTGGIREAGFPDHPGLAIRLRSDRLTGWFLRSLFEVPGVGSELGAEGPAALAELCADRPALRSSLLDGCLFRLRASPPARRPSRTRRAPARRERRG
jgi:hypothetical protein